MKRMFLIIVGIAFVASSICIEIGWTEYVSVCNRPVASHLEKYSNLFDENFDGHFAIEEIGFPFGVHELNIQECVNQVVEKRKASEVSDSMLSSKSIDAENVGKLLTPNRINYNSDTITVTGGPAF